METLINNKLADMFNIDIVKQMIKDCPNDEIVILLPHYSINKPKYNDEEQNNGIEFDDMNEFGDYLGGFLSVSDYDDLICDPHGIIE